MFQLSGCCGNFDGHAYQNKKPFFIIWNGGGEEGDRSIYKTHSDLYYKRDYFKYGSDNLNNISHTGYTIVSMTDTKKKLTIEQVSKEDKSYICHQFRKTNIRTAN